MSISEILDHKFNELEKLLTTEAYKQSRISRGGPFISLLYPPDEEVNVRKRINLLAKKLESSGWKIYFFEPEPHLYKFLESKGKAQDAFETERQNPAQLRSAIAVDLYLKKLSEIGNEDKEKHILFVLRAGGFFPHVNLHSLQEKLVDKIKMTTVFFIPAVEIEGHQYLFLGTEKTQKYRGIFI